MNLKEKIKEIAQKLNVTESTVETWLSRNREELSKIGAVIYEKRGRIYKVKDIDVERFTEFIFSN